MRAAMMLPAVLICVAGSTIAGHDNHQNWAAAFLLPGAISSAFAIIFWIEDNAAKVAG